MGEGDRREVGAHDGVRWRFDRAVDRIQAPVEAILVDHAKDYWQRGTSAHTLFPEPGRDDHRLVWTIDRQVVLEFRFDEAGPSELVVHDFSLLDPLRGAIRSRHVTIRFATAEDPSPL